MQVNRSAGQKVGGNKGNKAEKQSRKLTGMRKLRYTPEIPRQEVIIVCCLLNVPATC